jgi:hypothetical protein
MLILRDSKYEPGGIAKGFPPLTMVFFVARASRPCVSRASCPRFEGKMPSSQKSKAKPALSGAEGMASPRSRHRQGQSPWRCHPSMEYVRDSKRKSQEEL